MTPPAELAKRWAWRTVSWGFWGGWVGGSVALWVATLARTNEPLPYKLGLCMGGGILGVVLVAPTPAIATAWFLFQHLANGGRKE